MNLFAVFTDWGETNSQCVSALEPTLQLIEKMKQKPGNMHMEI
jgi:hypothetical protein